MRSLQKINSRLDCRLPVFLCYQQTIRPLGWLANFFMYTNFGFEAKIPILFRCPFMHNLQFFRGKLSVFFRDPARFSNPPQIGFCCNNYSWSLEISFLAFGFRQELSNLVSREVWKTGRERAALLPMSKDARGRRKYRIICHHWEETWINYVF